MSVNLSTATLHANKLTLLQMVVLYISTGRRCSFAIRTNLTVSSVSPPVEVVVSMEAQRSRCSGWRPRGVLLLTEMV